MILFYSKTSPYARKVWICAKLHGLDSEITLETLNPIKNSDVLEQTNPLGKVPALVTEKSQLIVDSPVICHLLDQLALSRGGQSLFGEGPQAYQQERVLEAMADGIMDAAYLHVMESNRPAEQQSSFWKERWSNTIRRTLSHLNRSGLLHSQGEPLTLGRIALGCALGYLDFRMDSLEWRNECHSLAVWYQGLATESVFRETAPEE